MVRGFDVPMTEPEELHPYDGRERRFGHDDADSDQRARGRALVARLLGLPAPPAEEGLRYALSFYSGGIGVIDRLHVAMPCAGDEAEAIAARAGWLTPEAVLADDEERGEIEWLVQDDEHPERTLAEAIAAFIEEHRADFQPRAAASARLWVAPGSGVNAWTIVYAIDGELALLGYDQG